jgi:hypothetical protein
MEVGLTSMGVIFEGFITALNRKAVWKTLAHFIVVHFKLPVVDIKLFACEFIFLRCGLAYCTY